MKDGIEIERKFLVANDGWRSRVSAAYAIVQGYLPAPEGDKGVRVRVMGSRGFLTLKGKRVGMSCPEQEVEIPVGMAKAMMHAAEAVVEKTRYHVQADDGLTWEVDVFHDANDGLVLAEIELEHEAQKIELPGWLGQEVTDDKRYSNRRLARAVSR